MEARADCSDMCCYRSFPKLQSVTVEKAVWGAIPESWRKLQTISLPGANFIHALPEGVDWITPAIVQRTCMDEKFCDVRNNWYKIVLMSHVVILTEDRGLQGCLTQSPKWRVCKWSQTNSWAVSLCLLVSRPVWRCLD